MENRILVIGLVLLLSFSSIIPISIGYNINISDEKESFSNFTNEVDWWPVFHHDQKLMGYSTSSAPSTNNILWSNGTLLYPWRNPVRCSPIVVDGKLYVAAVDPSYPIDTITSDEIGFKYFNNSFNYPIVSNNKNNNFEYLQFWNEAAVYCYNAFNGHTIWETWLPDEFWIAGSIVYADEKVYVVASVFLSSSNTSLYCLDANNGDILWNFRLHNDFYVTPVIVDEKVFISGMNIKNDNSMECSLYCLNGVTGAEIYNKTIGDGEAVETPAFYDNYLYLVVMDKNLKKTYLYCINISDGSIIWQRYIGQYYGSSPVVYSDKVFCSSSTWPEEDEDPPDGTLYCMDLLTGDELWNFSTLGLCNVWSTPAIAYDNIYYGTLELTFWPVENPNCTMYCLDTSNGDIIWNKTLENYLATSPAVADGKVYICSNDYSNDFNSSIYCLDAVQGDIIWQYRLFLGALPSPAIANGILYIAAVTLSAFTDNIPTNNPPTVSIDGSSTGMRFLKYKYTITADDLESNYINVLIEFSDNNETVKYRVSSGKPLTISHRWKEEGEYYIRAMVQDGNYTWSDWTVFKITISKPRCFDMFIMSFLNHFPMFKEVFSRLITG